MSANPTDTPPQLETVPESMTVSVPGPSPQQPQPQAAQSQAAPSQAPPAQPSPAPQSDTVAETEQAQPDTTKQPEPKVQPKQPRIIIDVPAEEMDYEPIPDLTTDSDDPAAAALNPEISKMQEKLSNAKIPKELRKKAQQQINRINLTLKYGGNLSQLDITTKYINWITSLPWYAKTEDVLDVNQVKQTLNKTHFGLDKLKQKILEYLSIIALQKKQGITDYHIQTPFFVGLAGTGKTTFAKAIADALGRQFVRIPFGGLSSARDLRGQSKVSPESEPGYVIKAVADAKVRNPVILLDELDRVSPDARAEIMGVLLELLDPGQNATFTDYFLDYPFNLNEVLFVATGNNSTNVAAAVLDRLDVIQMPNYTDEEKIAIGKNYVLPKLRQQAGIEPEQLQIEDDVWPLMVRPLGFEPGIRSLERMVNNIVRKVAYQIVSGQGNEYHISKDTVKDYTNIVAGA